MTLTTEQVARVHALADARGVLLPDRIIEDARDKRSPLHDLFEWNQAKAADAHRLDQARAVIGAVRVVVTHSTTVIRAPMYVRDPAAGPNERGYRSTVALRSEPQQAREALVLTLRVAAGHIERGLELAESLGLTSEIDALLEEIVGLQRKLQRTAA